MASFVGTILTISAQFFMFYFFCNKKTIGKFITPIFVPLGFGNWAIVASLVAGLVAKEVVVSSIAMFNGIDAGANKLIWNNFDNFRTIFYVLFFLQ